MNEKEQLTDIIYISVKGEQIIAYQCNFLKNFLYMGEKFLIVSKHNRYYVCSKNNDEGSYYSFWGINFKDCSDVNDAITTFKKLYKKNSITIDKINNFIKMPLDNVTNFNI